jgi:hypothetical protein
MEMQLLNKFKCFMAQSHRWAHFLGGLVLGLVFGLDATVAVAAAMEFKDCQHDHINSSYCIDFRRWNWRSWDWWDFAMTVAGGLIGSVIRWLVVGRFM